MPFSSIAVIWRLTCGSDSRSRLYPWFAQPSSPEQVETLVVSTSTVRDSALQRLSAARWKSRRMSALEAHPHLKHLQPEKARRQAARKRQRLSMARRGKMGSL